MSKKLFGFLKTNLGKILLHSITFVFLFALVLNNVGLSLRSKIQLSQTLDFSWFSDSIERLLHGYIQGKDFTFTYGPFFQLIYSLPSLIFHVSSYVSVALSPIISYILLFILVFRISQLLLNDCFKRIAYILFVFIILGFINANSDLVRIAMLIYYPLELLNVLEDKLIKWYKCILLAVLPTFFGLFSYNLFILTLLVSVVYVAIKLIKVKINKKPTYLLLFLPSVLFFQLIFSLIFTHNLEYIIYSLDSVSNYRYLMDLVWTRDRANIMLIFPISLIFFGINLIKTKIISIRTRNMLLMLILSSLIGLLSALSRSDAGHLIFGIYPSLIVFFTIVFILSKRINGLILLAFIFYLFVPSKPTFYNTFSPKNMLKVIQTLKNNPSFFNVYKLPAVYYSDNEISDLMGIIRENRGKVFIYPYDSYILNILNSTFNSFALGLYSYSSSGVEQRTVEGFMRNPPTIIILGIDTKGALNLDDIPNFTRNPILAKWIIRNYIILKTNPKYLVLSFARNIETSRTNKRCLYENLAIDLAKKDTFVEKIISLIKPSLYYVGSIRLPYSPWATSYLIFNDAYSLSGVSNLFQNNMQASPIKGAFDKNGYINVIRVSPFLGQKEIKKFNREEYYLTCQG